MPVQLPQINTFIEHRVRRLKAAATLMQMRRSDFQLVFAVWCTRNILRVNPENKLEFREPMAGTVLDYQHQAFTSPYRELGEQAALFFGSARRRAISWRLET
jgi:hypothetical protein